MEHLTVCVTLFPRTLIYCQFKLNYKVQYTIGIHPIKHKTHTHTHTPSYTHKHTHTPSYTHKHTHTHTPKHTYVKKQYSEMDTRGSRHIEVCVCVCLCVYEGVCVCLCVYEGVCV